MHYDNHIQYISFFNYIKDELEKNLNLKITVPKKTTHLIDRLNERCALSNLDVDSSYMAKVIIKSIKQHHKHIVEKNKSKADFCFLYKDFRLYGVVYKNESGKYCYSFRTFFETNSTHINTVFHLRMYDDEEEGN